MDVFDYRKIILANKAKSILKPINQEEINKGHCFIQNDTQMCIGWLLYDRIYPVFQGTIHKRNLEFFELQLKSEINNRYSKQVFNIFYEMHILPIEIINLIIKYI